MSIQVFISYRGGPGEDGAIAAHIHDFLRERGYESYHDKDQDKNRIGAQFPETIENALKHSKVIIAVIGDRWLKEAGRLTKSDDWVRRELYHARPENGKHCIPIYLGGNDHSKLPPLPSELAFLKTTNPFVWPRGFHDPEKQSLCKTLGYVIPARRSVGGPADDPRLELICDRVLAEDGFRDALLRRHDRLRPGCLLLFGEDDQEHADFFLRIEAYTLSRQEYEQRYPVRKMIQVKDLDDCRGFPLSGIHTRVIESVASELHELISTYDQLYEKLDAQGWHCALSML